MNNEPKFVPGEIVRYYTNGWRYGKVEAIHPRNKTVDIVSLGVGRKPRKGSKRAQAGLPGIVNLPLSSVEPLPVSVTLEPGETIWDQDRK